MILKKYIKTVAFTLLASSALISCESILDFEPENTQKSEDFYKKGEDIALQNLTAIYNNFYDFSTFGFSFIGFTEIISDNADKGSSPSDTGRDKHLIDALDIDENNESVNEIWKGYFIGISKANKLISKFEGMKSKNIERYLAEAKFLRAFYYFSLVRWFGDIPLVTTSPDDDLSEEAIKNARTRVSKALVYEQIVKDLKAGLTLPKKSELPASEVGRVTSTAAKAFLAKVYLYQKNWDEVIRLTNELGSEGLDLAPNYDVMFRESGENGIESIFEVQCKGTQPALGVGGYVEMQLPRGISGWGFNTPSESLINAYEPNDRRKAGTVLDIHTNVTMWDGFTFETNAVEAGAPKVYNKKVYVSKTRETYDNGFWVTNKNIRLMRYAEILLMNAEAHARKGETSGEGYTALNRVRIRAGLANTDLTLENVLKERRIELAFEHDRWFDLVRTRTANTAMTAAGKTWNDKLWLLPIPKKQIEISHNLLTQNPGY